MCNLKYPVSQSAKNSNCVREKKITEIHQPGANTFYHTGVKNRNEAKNSFWLKDLNFPAKIFKSVKNEKCMNFSAKNQDLDSK